MGLSPDAVGRMSLWKFTVCCEAWRKAHDPKAEQELSDAEFDELAAFLDG